MLRLIGSFVAFIFCASFAFADGTGAIPGQYLVKLKESSPATESLQKILGGKILHAIPDTTIVLVQRSLDEAPGEGLRLLGERPEVEIVEPNYEMKILKAPNDPHYSDLWGLDNRGQRGQSGERGISGVDIDAERAWQITTGSRKVVVAIVDTGVGADVEDLKPNLWINKIEAQGKPDVDDDRNGYVDDIQGFDFTAKSADPTDSNGHGTHVAGIIGAVGDNETGIAGVNWNVTLMPLKAFDGEGNGSTAHSIEAIRYAVKKKARIINASWGSTKHSRLLDEAIQYAKKNHVLFVAAAGNDGGDNDRVPLYPASAGISTVISVAAVDRRGHLADFSNYGEDSVDIAAPGVDILSTTPDGLKTLSGTSMATPFVTGVAALVLSQSPNLSAYGLKMRLIRTVSHLDDLEGRVSSGGIVDAYRALYTKPKPKPVPHPRPRPRRTVRPRR
jgi:subtilisin family serine protease